MELIAVTCNHCGAPLEVPDSARFVTCRYCNSRLEVKRTESSVSTQVLEEIDRNTAAMAEDLAVIRRETELERLDREWSQRREVLGIRGKDGSVGTPTAAMGILVMVVMGGFGLIWTIVALAVTGVMAFGAHSMGVPGALSLLPCIFPLFGIFFVALAIFLGVKTIGSAGKYQEEARAYQQRRAQLLAQAPQDPSAPHAP
jgi:DNA-directed RNA polymerase subunit RPC12/RpoP